MLEGIKRMEAGACVSDIVKNDYRTAGVFKKYDIDFCCGGKFPLEIICANKGLAIAEVLQELEAATYTIASHAAHEYHTWKPDFLADYIIHVHHRYLEKAIPETTAYLEHLTKKHSAQYTYLPELRDIFETFSGIIAPRQQQEEEIIFPYIRQVTRAYLNKESYAALLVRTLRKPVEQVMLQEQKTVETLIRQLRELTQNYTPPPNACITHSVALLKLQELDNDIVHHMRLENDMLYPRVLIMETELMNQKD
ncbi:DUF542 domain-containing protein [Agriterribacter sp.]|uniref:DUF542 domain-containing protein n=1 Tax=Agriterribacter sp. TaxID=2821509 RepID=UPI002B819BCA|nr:DUF542 domain-containing protein [Agriterribacter sp.]HRO46290.1 DUF542 domain-containing protein [Agriterribacter sp.]HRQ18531.1 DUF542 domain-containing protein [Agriterribacter sp.]